MPDQTQHHPAGTGARQPRSGLTMTWVPQRDEQGRTRLVARWTTADVVSAARSAA